MSKHNGNPEGERFTKLEGAEYDRMNEFIREHMYLTAREWAVLRVSQDLYSEYGVPTKEVGQRLPEIVPFIEDEYSRQNVHNARQSAREKVIKAGATFLYATMTGAFDADENDDIMYEARERAELFLEAEGADLDFEDEKRVEDRLRDVMRDIRATSTTIEPDE